MQPEFLKTKQTKITASNDNYVACNFYTRILKSLIDKFVAFFLLILLSPLFLVIAVLIKIESTGAVFFRQSRVGLNGKNFLMFKFRSMNVTEDGDDVVQVKKNDTRITRVGSFIRKTSIDELPQLINVLLGDMSLVGPRPHVLNHDIEFTKRIADYPKRHVVLPGITGLAQIKGYRGPTDTDEQLLGRVQYDIIYTKNISLWSDLKILFKTALIVFNDKKAF
jgi:putative colanic acid biosynthesis UDP-glucose lipid carrier transferase